MIQHNAYYMFIINMGIVLFTAWILNLYAIYADENKKKPNGQKMSLTNLTKLLILLTSSQRRTFKTTKQNGAYHGY